MPNEPIKKQGAGSQEPGAKTNTPSNSTGVDASTWADVMNRLNLGTSLEPGAGSGEQGAQTGKPKAETPKAKKTEHAETRGRGEEEEEIEETETPEEQEAGSEELGAEEETTEETEELGAGSEELGAEEEETEEQGAESAAVTELQAQLEAEKARTAELEAKLAEAGKAPRPAQEVAPVHPLFLEDDPAKLAARERKLTEFERWALENWDGVEAVEAKDGQPGSRAYSAAEVRARYAELKEEREQILPRARALAQERKALTDEARRAYPELFDSKRPESQLAEAILQQAPGLKAVFPNVYLVLGDAFRGEKQRLAAAKAGKGKTPAGAAAGKPAVRTSGPKVPARPAAGAARPAARKAGPVDVSAVEFMQAGGDRAALVNLLRKTNLPTQKAES